MVEELKRPNENLDNRNFDETKKEPDSCYETDIDCITSHICYKYSSMVMAGLIEAIDYFAGSQGPKVLVRILAKSIPSQMMEALGVEPESIKNLSEEEMIKLLPEMIAKKGGPKIKIEKNSEGGYKFELDECHFLPYSKSEGFCNVTAGLMLGFAQFLSGKPMDIKEIQTIAHGGQKCEFVATAKKF